MKILHITASYKPAYVYGGPIYSVAALCEALSDSSTPLRMTSASTELKEEDEREEEEILKYLPVGQTGVQDEKCSYDLLRMICASTSLSTNVEVITTLANGNEELPYTSGEKRAIEGVAVRYFKRLTKDHSHFSPALLWWLWKNAKQYDVVHIHSWWNLVSMGSVLVCLLRGIKPIVSPRGMLGDYTFTKGKKLFHRLIGKRLLKRCDFHATTMMEAEEIGMSFDFAQEDKVFDFAQEDSGFDTAQKNRVSDFAQEDSVFDFGQESCRIIDLTNEGVESRKWEEEKRKEEREKNKDKKMPSIFVIHNMVKLPEVLPEKTRTFDGILKLIFLSRIHHKKGIELLMDALTEVPFAFSLSIVGEGESDYVESLKWKAKSLGLAKHIEWLGPVYGEEKYRLLAEHDLFVLPSFNENFANVIVESLAVKTPVLISDKVGLCHYVQKNGLGLVHSNNVDSLTNSLTAFYNQPVFVKDITKDFSPLHLRNQYLEMYHEIF